MRLLSTLLIPLTLTLMQAVAAAEELTLEGAVRFAIENNPAVRSARAEADAAEARARQARGFRLPSVDLMHSFSRTDNPAEAFALQLNQERFDMMEFFQSDPNHPDAINTWMTRLEVTQPVYTGGKLSARIDQAELMATAEELRWRHAVEQVAFDATTAFINLAKAREMLELVIASRSTTTEHVKLAESMAGQGFLVSADVLQARVHLAQMDEQLALAKNGAALAEAALNFQLGMDQTSSHQLADLPPHKPVAGGLGDWISAALERRRDLAAARRQLDTGRLEERVARAAFLPEVAVVGRFDLYDDTPLGSHGDSSSLMAVARINLYRGGSDKAALAAARHGTAAGERGIDRFVEGIRLEVRQAWQDMITAGSRHQTATASLAAAEEALRVRDRRFRQGLDRMIDLLDAETALHEAQMRELVARHDLVLAETRLHFVSGASLTEDEKRVKAKPVPQEEER